jgi:hypothetical protein
MKNSLLSDKINALQDMILVKNAKSNKKVSNHPGAQITLRKIF